MNFSQRLTALLEERGWTQYRLAKNMDISQSTVSHWLNGEGMPQKHTLKRLAETLDVEVSYFTAPDVIMMLDKKTVPVTEDGLQRLDDDERVLLEHYRTMTEDDRERMQDFARRLKSGD